MLKSLLENLCVNRPTSLLLYFTVQIYTFYCLVKQYFIVHFRLKEQLQSQNNKNVKSDDQIRNLENQLAEKMKQIKLKKEQMKKKGAYG